MKDNNNTITDDQLDLLLNLAMGFTLAKTKDSTNNNPNFVYTLDDTSSNSTTFSLAVTKKIKFEFKRNNAIIVDDKHVKFQLPDTSEYVTFKLLTDDPSDTVYDLIHS